MLLPLPSNWVYPLDGPGIKRQLKYTSAPHLDPPLDLSDERKHHYYLHSRMKVAMSILCKAPWTPLDFKHPTVYTGVLRITVLDLNDYILLQSLIWTLFATD